MRTTSIITQTPRLIVREYLPDEEVLFLELLSDPLVTDYLPKRNNDENSKIFQDALADYKKGSKLARWGYPRQVKGAGNCHGISKSIGRIRLQKNKPESNFRRYR